MSQPYLHDLVSSLHAPTVALSGTDGQIRPGGVQGVLHGDQRVLATFLLDVAGVEPTPVGHHVVAADTATFVGVVRDLGDPGADPTVRVERERQVDGSGLTERVRLVNASRSEVTTTIRLRAGVDFADTATIKHGDRTDPVAPVAGEGAALTWNDPADRVRVELRLEGAEPEIGGAVGPDGLVSWRVRVPARTTWAVALRLAVHVRAADPNAFAASAGPGWDRISVDGPQALTRAVERGVDDLTALTMADPAALDDVFIGAGSPWYFTLFGRDSLWAARLTLPLGTGLAGGTLRTLARRQGRRHDDDTAEAPGKILHEVRSQSAVAGGHQLPPVYYGTIDATALWVCLLHDAWRWGMPTAEVADLLDPLEAALTWIRTDADADGDGLCEYLDGTGRGLANQGWKDSHDAIQFPDGTLATGPIALCEAQAYAHEAAVGGAAVLTAFGRSGSAELATWAAGLRQRFRDAFWVSDARGRFPALALDARKRPVSTASSNLGHLLGTGLLDATEAAAVAARLAAPDLDCGYGLRTMTADATGFNPLGYHTGTVWPHDTAIAILGLARAGHHQVASSLARGLLRAAPEFDFRLPELFAGTRAGASEPVLAYPASCRPQAWSSAAAIAVLHSALGLRPDVPGATLRVAPAKEFSWLWPLRVAGLRVGGQPLTIEVDAAGHARLDTTADIQLD